MTINETRHKILADNNFVISECHRLQTLNGLKTVTRYDLKRKEVIHTESVAEHIYAMHSLATYFLPLENPEGDWDKERLRLMIQFHDIDEIVTGDKIGYEKTAADRVAEEKATVQIINQIPESLQGLTKKILEEYGEQETVEAKFVKAIDKLEPAFHLYNENGRKIVNYLKTTRERHRLIKDEYLIHFPYMNRFHNVIDDAMQTKGFYDHNT